MMASSPSFKKGESVLCYHGPVPYPAKILEFKKDRKKKDKETGEEVPVPFKVHYSGWNTRHDEWVGADRLLADTPENAEFAQQKITELEEASGGKKKTPKPKPGRTPGLAGAKRKAGDAEDKDGGSSRASSPSMDSKAPRSSRASVTSDQASPVPKADTSRVKKTRTPRNVEPRKEFSSRPEVKITIPRELKQNLVDDWDLVSRQYRILKLPCDETVDDLVEEYKKEKQSEKSISQVQRDLFCESAEGVRAHFNAMLGTQLLYKLERAQYCDLREADSEFQPSKIYGYIHLVRLFVRMGTMLAYTPWNEACIKRILDHILDFVTFLKRKNSYSKLEYQVATLEYQKRVWN